MNAARVTSALRNRIDKNLRRLRPWLQQQRVTCFRVYDRDVPEVPLALDVYTTIEGERWLHATVFEPRHGVEAARVAEWVGVAADTLAVAPAHVMTKRRTAGVGHEKLAETGERLQVEEGGARFWVNLVDYVDTGLFLDHRLTRAMVAGWSRGKRVLNLFAYTGAFSVYAAKAGAARTVSVDLSTTYARWTRDNLALNGFGAENHEIVVADALEWLVAERAVFDVVVIDPPTISKSKRAAAFDVQRDHERLVTLALARLVPGGLAMFSTNFQGFELGNVPARSIDDVTALTVPPDFPRKPPIHRAWRIEK